MAKEHKVIKKWKEAWTFLGEVFEGFELARIPDEVMFTQGICNELDAAVNYHGWTSGGHLATIIKKNIAPDLITKMYECMRNTTDLQGDLEGWTQYGSVGESVFLGKTGDDYATRALWCYLMAEAGPTPDYGASDEERRYLQKIHGVHPDEELPLFDDDEDEDDYEDGGWD